MAIPSRVLGAGVNSLATVSICGDGLSAATAVGTSAGNATQLTYVYTNVNSASAGTGVKLPPTETGETIWVANSTATDITIYPYESGTNIDGSASVVLHSHCSAAFFAVSPTLWQCLQGYNSAVPILHYGSFSDTTTQVAASINTAYAMTFNTTDISNGVSRGSPTSRLVVANQGVYNVQFSAQLEQTSGATANVYIWLRKDGTNVPNSSTTIAIQGTASRTVAAWNFLAQLEPSGYVELMWATDSTNVRILAASATSVWPAIPSVIATLTQVNDV